MPRGSVLPTTAFCIEKVVITYVEEFANQIYGESHIVNIAQYIDNEYLPPSSSSSTTPLDQRSHYRPAHHTTPATPHA